MGQALQSGFLLPPWEKVAQAPDEGRRLPSGEKEPRRAYRPLPAAMSARRRSRYSAQRSISSSTLLS